LDRSRRRPDVSGKSEDLIRRLRRAEIARQRVQIFKPAIDEALRGQRDARTPDSAFPRTPSSKPRNHGKLSPRTEVIRHRRSTVSWREVVDVCTKARQSRQTRDRRRLTPITAAARLNRCRASSPSPKRSPNFSAICVRCGNPAVHTQRLVESEELIVVGAMGAVRSPLPRALSPIRTRAREKGRPSAHRPQPRRRRWVNRLTRCCQLSGLKKRGGSAGAS